MPILDWVLKAFDSLGTLAMRFRPVLTVWTADKLFLFAPKAMRKIVERFASQRILACVAGGELPILPHLNGGDAIFFYPLPQCTRYEVLEHPHLQPEKHFGGKIYVFIIPPELRRPSYTVCGYDQAEHCFSSGQLHSHGADSPTQIVMGSVKKRGSRLRWPLKTRRYLASFIMVHTNYQPHAAVYTRSPTWRYPHTKRLPHIVIPPDGTDLDQAGVGLFIMVVEADAWVPTILAWQSSP